MPGAAAPLLEQIRGTAAAAAAEGVTLARAGADAIRERAREGAKRERAGALLARRQAAAIADSRTRAETAVRVGRQTLTARGAALDRVFAEAGRRLDSLATHPGLRDLLGATITDGLTYLLPEHAVVVCGEAIAETVRAALAAAKLANIEVRADARVPIGVLVESGDGALVVDGTFARRLARERPRLSTVLARRLVENSK